MVRKLRAEQAVRANEIRAVCPTCSQVVAAGYYEFKALAGAADRRERVMCPSCSHDIPSPC